MVPIGLRQLRQHLLAEDQWFLLVLVSRQGVLAVLPADGGREGLPWELKQAVALHKVQPSCRMLLRAGTEKCSKVVLQLDQRWLSRVEVMIG